jgi:uncharacterized protein (TIGR03083 family)
MEHRTVEDHVAALRAAVSAFAEEAAAAGLQTPVPTCPRWTVHDLLAHQGMVHRWARANLLGEQCHPPSWNEDGHQVEDPVAWLLQGAHDLVQTIVSVDEDVRAMVFLKDAPPPRVFWARRQCHETTIHAVDALAARVGEMPAPELAGWVEEPVALDGLDELLTGFVTRGRSRFAGVPAARFTVRPEETDRSWTVSVAADGTVSTTRDEPVVKGEASLNGTARALYLALWNRTGGAGVSDATGVMETWRSRARVRWS